MSRFQETNQWKSGQSIEDFLDKLHRDHGWQVERTTPHEERVLCLGDRHMRKDDEHFLVEYKSGIQTFYTGNVFLETVSVDTQNKPGWVYTCKADVILYAALLNNRILVFQPNKLRFVIEELKSFYPEVSTKNNQNEGYNTHGVIIPLAEAEKIAYSIVYLGETISVKIVGRDT